jgi:hypothetical protein
MIGGLKKKSKARGMHREKGEMKFSLGRDRG